MKKINIFGICLLLVVVCNCSKMIESMRRPDYYEIESPHNSEVHCSIGMVVDGEDYSYESLFYIKKHPVIIGPGYTYDYPREITISKNSFSCKTKDFYLEMSLADKSRWKADRKYSIGGISGEEELVAACYCSAPGKSKSYMTIKTGSVSIEPLNDEYSVKVSFEFDAIDSANGTVSEFRKGFIISDYRHNSLTNMELF